MTRILQLLGPMLACFLMLAGPSFAQDQAARVVVPGAPPGGAYVDGCYRVDRPLYGPYRIRLCFGNRGQGTYAVQGPQLTCEGRLTWRVAGDTVNLSLRRTSCNLGRAWAAAEVTCRPRGLVSVLLDELIREITGQGSGRPRVVVPDRPTVGRLTCTYYPTVAGAPIRPFFANRILQEPRS
ncbi:hypothetical protein [Roseicyclus persicicus]|uniref:Uncharacterized protein n=1 Tax=Roseicyclus persicicus TaxID=2650661 RepID=A0A7X6GX54_9RHOB|nr:hypothetical protein [Roseibacterium persicicum]NKX43294.1 hypothetical protein [Roseibacterium persicicum]